MTKIVLPLALLLIGINTAATGTSVTTSMVSHLPGPIYDMETSGSTLFVLASTGEGTKGFFDPIPPPGFYASTNGTSISRVHTFGKDQSPTQFSLMGNVVCFNNLNGDALGMLIQGDPPKVRTSKELPTLRKADLVTANGKESLALGLDTSGTLTLAHIGADPGMVTNAISQLSTDYQHGSASLLHFKDSLFIVAFQSQIALVDMQQVNPSIIKQINVDVISTDDGFKYPHRLIANVNEKVYFINGQNSISILNLNDESHVSHKIDGLESITAASVNEDELLCGSIDGQLLSIKLEDFSTNWQVKIEDSWITTILRTGANVYIGDRKGRVVRIKPVS